MDREQAERRYLNLISHFSLKLSLYAELSQSFFFKKKEKCWLYVFFYLGSDSREFEGLEGLVIDGGTWIDVDHHAGGSSPTEETLQDTGEFTVPEGNHLRRPRPVDAPETCQKYELHNTLTTSSLHTSRHTCCSGCSSGLRCSGPELKGKC